MALLKGTTPTPSGKGIVPNATGATVSSEAITEPAIVKAEMKRIEANIFTEIGSDNAKSKFA
jgi:hypothetical protein